VLSKWKIAIAGGLILLAFVAAAVRAEGPVTVVVGDLELVFDGSVAPTKLPRDKLAPIGFSGSGSIATTDGIHPPALEEFVLESDRNTSLDVAGVPVCRATQLQSQDSSHARAICGKAIIGTGIGKVEIAFPEQAPIRVTSPLTIFNGGEQGSATTLYVHIYVTVPAPAAVVTTVKLTKIHHGRYGLRAVATIPRIAGGSGSATYFSFTIDRFLTVGGKQLSVLRAKCPDGHLQAHGLVRFSDGVRAAANIVRRCLPQG
jgi:hypothetical protein